MGKKTTQRVVANLTGDIAGTLRKAAALAEAARDLAQDGKVSKAVADLLELEPLIYDARGLIGAATLLHRRQRKGCG